MPLIGKLTKHVLRMLVDDLRDKNGRYHFALLAADREELVHLQADLQDLTADTPIEIVPVEEMQQRQEAKKAESWQHVPSAEGPKVRRLQVPGGYLYQVERETEAAGRYAPTKLIEWYAPVFVPGRELTPDALTAIVDAARSV